VRVLFKVCELEGLEEWHSVCLEALEGRNVEVSFNGFLVGIFLKDQNRVSAVTYPEGHTTWLLGRVGIFFDLAEIVENVINLAGLDLHSCLQDDFACEVVERLAHCEFLVCRTQVCRDDRRVLRGEMEDRFMDVIETPINIRELEPGPFESGSDLARASVYLA